MKSELSGTSFRGLLLIALAAILLMGFVPIIIKWVSANEATIGLVRLSIAALGIALLLKFKGRKLEVSKNDLKWLILLGFVFAVHWYTYFKSIKLSDASLAAIGVATFGIHLLFLNRVFYGEKLNAIDFVAVIVAFIGIYLTSPTLTFSETKVSGFFIAILSGFLYACLPLINRKIPHLSTNVRALGQFGFALIFFLPLLPMSNFQMPTNDWIGLIVLGVVSTLVAHTLWIKASTELPTSITAVIYYCYVPMAIILGFYFLDESLNWEKLTGASLIIGANIMVALFHKKKQIKS